jgi:hypothetical protein
MPARNCKGISRASFTRERPRALFVLQPPPLPEPESPVEPPVEPAPDEGMFFDLEENSGLLVLI